MFHDGKIFPSNVVGSPLIRRIFLSRFYHLLHRLFYSVLSVLWHLWFRVYRSYFYSVGNGWWTADGTSVSSTFDTLDSIILSLYRNISILFIVIFSNILFSINNGGVRLFLLVGLHLFSLVIRGGVFKDRYSCRMRPTMITTYNLCNANQITNL